MADCQSPKKPRNVLLKCDCSILNTLLRVRVIQSALLLDRRQGAAFTETPTRQRVGLVATLQTGLWPPGRIVQGVAHCRWGGVSRDH